MWNVNVGGYTEYPVVYAHNVFDIRTLIYVCHLNIEYPFGTCLDDVCLLNIEYSFGICLD